MLATLTVTSPNVCETYHQVALVYSLSLGEEPLLKESLRRFVLFPIQYEEVSPPTLNFHPSTNHFD